MAVSALCNTVFHVYRSKFDFQGSRSKANIDWAISELFHNAALAMPVAEIGGLSFNRVIENTHRSMGWKVSMAVAIFFTGCFLTGNTFAWASFPSKTEYRTYKGLTAYLAPYVGFTYRLLNMGSVALLLQWDKVSRPMGLVAIGTSLTSIAVQKFFKIPNSNFKFGLKTLFS